jgi:alpha-amylase
MSSRATLAPVLRPLAAAAILSVVACACGTSTVTSSFDAPSASAGIASASVNTDQPPACELRPSSPAAEPAAWWRDRTFYEVFVRSFADSDGDGIGDLRGLTQKLDYLNDGNPATTTDLGVTALWLMPVAESPSYHGYDVTGYKAIEKDYGTADDFRALMTAAHARGINVIVDLVLNHTSIDHPWFQDSRTPGSKHDDWYVWSTERPTFGGPGGLPVWHKDGDRWYYAYFWEGMPDLNLRSPDVTAALNDVSRFWLDDLGVDGFRLDAARHLIEDGETLQNTPETFAWLAGFRARVHADKPQALVLGEVYDATTMSSRYVREGSLDLSFEFGLAGATIDSIRSSDAVSLRAAQQKVADSYPPGGVATFLTNHDQDRVADQLESDPAAEKLAAALLLTGQGVPFIYYGEEIGMTGQKPDERIRTPMRWDGMEANAGFSSATPWEALSDDPQGTDVATESLDPSSLVASYRTLVQLRDAHPALSHGDWTPIDSSSPAVLAYLRRAGSESVLVVSNLGDHLVDDVALSLASGPLCGRPAAKVLLGTSEVRPPVITPTGGFDGYVPVDRLAARGTIAITLAP